MKMIKCLETVGAFSAYPALGAAELLKQSAAEEGVSSILKNGAARLLFVVQAVASVIALPFTALAALALSWYSAATEDLSKKGKGGEPPIFKLTQGAGILLGMHLIAPIGAVALAIFAPTSVLVRLAD